MPARVLTALAALAVACAATAAPLQQVENLNVGPAPSALAVDAVSGRVIVGNSGSGRGQPGSLAVLERSGKLTTVATPSGPLHVAVSAARRKAVATLDREGAVAILDLDTLALRTLAAGRGPRLSLIDDAAGKAYVIGAERAMDLPRGWVSVIDLATYEVQSYSSVGFAPEDAVLAADGKRLYLVGNHNVRSGEYKPGFVQAFDIPGRRFVGAPTALGREAKRVARSPRGARLYVAGHTDQYRDGFPAGDLRRHSIRGALFTLDAATLALERTTALPDTRDLQLHGPMLTPQLQVDPATG
ncbi:MAG TPA: hypothetical protein VFN74_04825, partial [Chloroflexota bacterium]|nr:hypothetical protein [Chloroflexota bacterium]